LQMNIMLLLTLFLTTGCAINANRLRVFALLVY